MSLCISNSIVIFQMAFCSVTIFPIRVALCPVFLMAAWVFASIGLYGLAMKDINLQPFSGWRR